MKLSILFFIAMLVNVHANSYAQRKKMSISMNNVPLESVLTAIESESKFKFFYSVDKIDVDRRVSIDANRETIFEILDDLFVGIPITYSVVKNQIVLKAAQQLAETVPDQETETEDKNEQDFTVSGVVYDNSRIPIAGVNIIEKGTTNGIATNFDGEYEIRLQGENPVLVFSYLGYESQEIAVDGRNTIDVVMQEDSQGLDEVVVIGYGSRRKKDLTGAVSTINSEDLTQQVLPSAEFAIQGRLPGVFISNPGSNPNSRPEVRIRGISTLGFNDPLYVIDGVPVIEGGAAAPSGTRERDNRGAVNILNLINPNDIESITVLKDASATAIYGVRASNGVILIETKRGRKGKTNITFSQRFGISTLDKRYETLNSREYADISNLAWNNSITDSRDDEDYGVLFDPGSPEYLGNSPTFDWVDQGVRNTAVQQDYNVSVTGGNDSSNFAVSAGYTSQEDVLFDTSFERYSFSVNTDHRVTDWLSVGQSYRLAVTESPDEQVFQSNMFRRLTYTAPWQPIFDPANVSGFAEIGREYNGEFEGDGYGPATNANYFGYAQFWQQESTLVRNLGSAYAEIRPFPGFRIRGTLSVDYFTNRRDQFRLAEGGLYRTGELGSDGTVVQRRETSNFNLTKELLIGYTKSFGDHNFDLTLNAMDQRATWDILTVEAVDTGIASYDQRIVDEALSNDNKNSLLSRNESGLLGYLARLSYNYNGKYYLDGTIRRDGSSKFAEGYKWGNFPAVAVAWRLSSEKFMEGASWLNDLKFRAGWGQTGNQETRDFAYASLVNRNPSYPTSDGNINSGSALSDFPIIDTTWETVTTTNIGFDATLFNKLSLTAEYYFRETEDILQEIDIPDVIGAQTAPVVNLATVENKGIEIDLSYNDKFGHLGFSAGLNFTTVDNVVTELFNDRPQGSQEARIEEGFPIGYIYGYQTDGIFQSQAEVDAYLSQVTDPGNDAQLAPGDFRFRDIYGDPTAADGEFAYRSLGADGVINGLDRTYLGKTIPGYFYGLNFNLDYKGFDLGLIFRGVGDVQRINEARQQGLSMADPGDSNYLREILNYWTPENGSNVYPRLIAGDPSGNNRFSNRWVEDADFFRLQNLQFGYTFGPKITERLRATNIRLYTTLSNVFVITPYSGLDPENDTTPFTYTMGLNIGF
ncbi:TonB-dependent receptor [Poritiphilus flavus]|uniref:SusC/RagA family TonB-linked outer membrane protein n=1 Tax=Poritiphilus flavus TaxID=2697053 RepID=A0A6L9E802_9FLAO|nr:TonB-dependent receptor [Poritiphilus flavus]NAS10738.1 SusC/RagA family TonB-linked outer membrane protein [Poritiphilus flavus]